MPVQKDVGGDPEGQTAKHEKEFHSRTKQTALRNQDRDRPSESQSEDWYADERPSIP
jgi:hypothetical protein